MRIGILGGTFNPPHIGHLVCAQEALVELELERVLLIPARIPPHKQVEEEPGPEHRLELCRRAVGDDQRFAVSEIELRRAGLSYTVDTLTELHSTTPDNELFLIVGGDIAVGLPSWHQPERVLSLAHLAVAGRRGTARHAIEEALSGLAGGERVEFFRMPRIGVSSTMIRRRVHLGQPIRYLVPDPVAGYIEQHSLYGHGGHEH
ncbi:MAG: nicotinate-nucleotide adenylyltransferase [Solirubrobacteraceae bacterium]